MKAHGGFVTADGRRLEYQRIGEGPPDSPVLVLLHEGLGCISLWREFPRRVAEKSGLEVFVFSRAGYGGSDEAPFPREAGYMHHEGRVVLPQVIAAAGIQRHVLIGHSDGASIAVVYAGSGHRPGLEGLVLMAPHVFNEPLSIASIREAREAYEHGTLRAGLALHHGERVDHAFRGWNDVWLHPGFAGWNIEEFLPGISCPVLVIQGEEDQYGSARQVEAIEAGVSAPVTRLLVPDCRHSPHRERPQLTLDAITGFLRSPGPAAPVPRAPPPAR